MNKKKTIKTRIFKNNGKRRYFEIFLYHASNFHSLSCSLNNLKFIFNFLNAIIWFYEHCLDWAFEEHSKTLKIYFSLNVTAVIYVGFA